MRWLYKIAHRLFPNLIFYIPNSENWLLTIDDSPSENTISILDMLDQYQTKAIFFCIGKNIERYPEEFQEIIQRGHTVGYHSYLHKNIWRQSFEEFKNDFEKCTTLFSSNIYRPPYGKLTWRSYRYLAQKGYQIMLWDILTEDWKNIKNPIEKIKSKIKAAQSGSIFVFHDNEKSRENLKVMMRCYLESKNIFF